MKEFRRSSRWASKKTRVLSAAALAAVTLTAVAFVAVGGAATGGTRTTAAAAQYGPTNTALPAISGQATEGQTLTVQPGTWTGAVPISYAYQWQRCDTAGNNCASIGGAIGPTYVLQAADVGKTMRLVVTATNNEGSRSATSAQTAVVARVATPSVLAVSSVSLPERLVIRGVQFQPSPIRSRAEPLIVRFRVTTTKGIPVSGALVFARGVPSNRVSSGAERATGSDGWVEFTFQPLRALPLVRGATLVMFVRARKPNDDLLAGVSTRRLVQVRVNPVA